MSLTREVHEAPSNRAGDPQLATALPTQGTGPTIPQSVRALIGVRKTRRCLVTARDIKRFAQAIGETSPLHSREEPAAATADRTLVAPPLFCQTLAYEDLPIEELPPDGSPAELDVPLPARRVVGGGSEYVVHRLVRAGEVISVVTQLKDVYTKQGRSGLLYLLVLETRCTDEAGFPVATEVATYVKRE